MKGRFWRKAAIRSKQVPVTDKEKGRDSITLESGFGEGPFTMGCRDTNASVAYANIRAFVFVSCQFGQKISVNWRNKTGSFDAGMLGMSGIFVLALWLLGCLVAQARDPRRIAVAVRGQVGTGHLK